MTNQVRQAETSGMVKAVSVADYIVERLAAEGIDHCFGVAGDYVFPICDAVDSSAKVKWIGCANELNASYAADGYARIRGAAMLVTTYGVGELSALNGVMGAKAERSLVFHVVGMPSYQHQRLRKIAHHTLGDGVFGNFVELSAGAACCHAVINPENCVVEMERIIAEARRNNQPAYIAVPSDYALSPVMSADVKPIVPRSNEAALQKAMAIIAERINNAKSIVAFPAFTILRLGLQKQAQKAIEALGCPFVTTLMEKCVIDESHPQFAGMYAGAVSDPKTRQIVEGADLVLDLGGVNLNDITTAAYSGQLDLSRFITVGLDDVRIGDKVIANVRLADVLSELAKLKPSSAPYQGKTARTCAGERQTHPTRSRWPRCIRATQRFCAPGDTVVLETGSSSLGVTPTILPDGVRVEAQVLWGSIGWATPGRVRCRACRPEPAHSSDHWRRLASTDCERHRRHGTVWSKRHRLRTQQWWLSHRARAGGKSELDLQRPRTLELCRIAEGAGMRKLVYGACDHAWRARRGNEGRTRQQNRGVYRDHWRQNGHAAGPRLRPWPT